MEILIFIAAVAASYLATRALRKLWRNKGQSEANIRVGSIGAAFVVFVLIIAGGINIFPSESMKQQKLAKELQKAEQQRLADVSEKEKSRASDMASDKSIDAFIFCKNAVRESLKSPSTADFPMLDHNAWKMQNQVYVVKSYVDAQNSYGAMLRTNWRCEAKYLGGGKIDNMSWELIKLSLEE